MVSKTDWDLLHDFIWKLLLLSEKFLTKKRRDFFFQTEKRNKIIFAITSWIMVGFPDAKRSEGIEQWKKKGKYL